MKIIKIIAKRSEVDNKSSNAELVAFIRLLNKLLNKYLVIAIIISDNSKTLNRLFRNDFLFINHRLDLWHLLRKICLMVSSFFFYL